jgi:endonuclease YncB( thermonuclease family)
MAFPLLMLSYTNWLFTKTQGVNRIPKTIDPRTFLYKAVIILLFFTGVITLINTPASHAVIRTVAGTVIQVTDGDSIQVVTPEHTKLKVRLYGIDAPETAKVNAHSGQVNKAGQPYAEESRRALADKVNGAQIRLDVIDIDKYRRLVCMVWLGDRNINLEMVTEGHAEAFIEYLKPPYRAEFLDAEREAKSARRGIWSLPDYERPRAFRKRLKVSGGD